MHDSDSLSKSNFKQSPFSKRDEKSVKCRIDLNASTSFRILLRGSMEKHLLNSRQPLVRMNRMNTTRQAVTLISVSPPLFCSTKHLKILTICDMREIFPFP